jgi:hypothetical protein
MISDYFIFAFGAAMFAIWIIGSIIELRKLGK